MLSNQRAKLKVSIPVRFCIGSSLINAGHELIRSMNG
jgi:hypothetical protein